eukprot:2396647-Prymnesium_polylepis.1
MHLNAKSCAPAHFANPPPLVPSLSCSDCGALNLTKRATHSDKSPGPESTSPSLPSDCGAVSARVERLDRAVVGTRTDRGPRAVIASAVRDVSSYSQSQGKEFGPLSVQGGDVRRRRSRSDHRRSLKIMFPHRPSP